MDEIIMFLASMAVFALGFLSFLFRPQLDAYMRKFFGPASFGVIMAELQDESPSAPLLRRFIIIGSALLFTVSLAGLIAHFIVGHNIFVGTHHP